MTRSMTPPAETFSPQSVATTSLGSHRQRMKWTKDMNVFNLPLSYRPLLHERFIEYFPKYAHVTVQRIADQYSIIIRNTIMPATMKESARLQVTGETGDQEPMEAEVAALNTHRNTLLRPVQVEFQTVHGVFEN